MSLLLFHFGSYIVNAFQGFPGYNHLVEDFSMEGILAKGEKCQEFLDRSCLVGDQAKKGSTTAMHKNIFETEVSFGREKSFHFIYKP